MELHLLAALDAFTLPMAIIGFELRNLRIARLHKLCLDLFHGHPIWPRLISVGEWGGQQDRGQSGSGGEFAHKSSPIRVTCNEASEYSLLQGLLKKTSALSLCAMKLHWAMLQHFPTGPTSVGEQIHQARLQSLCVASWSLSVASQRKKASAIGVKTPYPGFIEPLLAEMVERVPRGERWLHEIKYDGYRAQLHIINGAIKVYTRRGHDWTKRFRKIATDADLIGVGSVIIDGEVVVPGEGGKTDFSMLQNSLRGTAENIVMVAFDMLYLNGRDLRRVPLVDRKALLKPVIAGTAIEHSEHFEIGGAELYRRACKAGLEGIVSKVGSSPYAATTGSRPPAPTARRWPSPGSRWTAANGTASLSVDTWAMSSSTPARSTTASTRSPRPSCGSS
jgi:hypothetical protein